MNIINVGYDSTNYYVIENKGPRLLIDTGWPGTLPKLMASLKRKGLTLRSLSYLCVTHYHPDHAGLAQELKNAGIKHIVLEEQLAEMPKLKSYMKPTAGYVDILEQDNIRLAASQSRAWLKNIGIQGEIVGTPGHSVDSISLVLDEGIAFTGDLTPAFMVNGAENQTVLQSWELLRRLKVRTIYPGHGPIRSLP